MEKHAQMLNFLLQEMINIDTSHNKNWSNQLVIFLKNKSRVILLAFLMSIHTILSVQKSFSKDLFSVSQRKIC